VVVDVVAATEGKVVMVVVVVERGRMAEAMMEKVEKNAQVKVLGAGASRELKEEETPHMKALERLRV